MSPRIKQINLNTLLSGVSKTETGSTSASFILFALRDLGAGVSFTLTPLPLSTVEAFTIISASFISSTEGSSRPYAWVASIPPVHAELKKKKLDINPFLVKGLPIDK